MIIVQCQRHLNKFRHIISSTSSCQNRNDKATSCKHEVFHFKVDFARRHAIIKQINMHGGLNNLLRQYGHCPLESCKQAIEKAFGLGLIGDCTYKQCIEINQKANKAKHVWDDDL